MALVGRLSISDILRALFGEKPDRGYLGKESGGTAGERMSARESPRKRPLRPETPPVRQAVIPLLPILFPAVTPTTFVSLPFLPPPVPPASPATTYLHIITIDETPRRGEIPLARRCCLPPFPSTAGRARRILLAKLRATNISNGLCEIASSRDHQRFGPRSANSSVLIRHQAASRRSRG